MKKNRLLVIVGIGVISIVIFVMMKSMVSQDNAKKVVQKELVEKKVETAWVLSTKKSVGVGEILSERNVEWLEWPRNHINKSYVYVNDKNSDQATKIAERLIGRRARVPLVEREPINEQKFLKISNGSLLSSMLQSGKRAMSVPIDEVTGAGGFILPNDRVDIIVNLPDQIISSAQKSNAYNPQNDISTKSNTDNEVKKILIKRSRTILKNVRVLAIDTIISENNIQTGNIAARTATLEVTPKQARILASAQAISNTLSLSLRSAADILEKDDEDQSEILSTALNQNVLVNNSQPKNNAIRVIRNGQSYNDKFLK